MIYLPSQSNIITHVNAGKRPQTRDTQAFTQSVNHDKGNLIENWLSTVPLSPENLVDPLQKTLEDMPSITGSSLHIGHISTAITPSAHTNPGVRAAILRESLSKRNIYIKHTDASSKLVEQAKEITATKRSTPEILMMLLPRNWQLQQKTSRLGTSTQIGQSPHSCHGESSSPKPGG